MSTEPMPNGGNGLPLAAVIGSAAGAIPPSDRQLQSKLDLINLACWVMIARYEMPDTRHSSCLLLSRVPWRGDVKPQSKNVP